MSKTVEIVRLSEGGVPRVSAKSSGFLAVTRYFRVFLGVGTQASRRRYGV